MSRIRLPGNEQHDYQVLRRNSQWPDHRLRTMVTAGMIAWQEPLTVCDPACGDASILEETYRLRRFDKAYLGDISVPNIRGLEVTFPHQARIGTAEETLAAIPTVDVIVLTEFLEHIEDPDAMLRLARSKGNGLIASSPLAEGPGNEEHLWSWDAESYQQMIREAGWSLTSAAILHWGPVVYQIYTAR